MCAVGCFGVDIVDEGDFIKDMEIGFALVLSSVDDAKADVFSVREEDEERHRKGSIDGARNKGEKTTGIVFCAELEGKEEIGIEELRFEGEGSGEALLEIDLFIGDLE